MKKLELQRNIAKTQDGRLTDSESGIDKIIVDAIENSDDIDYVRMNLQYAISELEKAVEETLKHDQKEPLDDKLGMTKLGDRNYSLIVMGIKSQGTYNPDENFCFFEEQLYVDEVDEIRKFLTWVHKNDKAFGSGNYEEVFHEFKVSKS